MTRSRKQVQIVSIIILLIVALIKQNPTKSMQNQGHPNFAPTLHRQNQYKSRTPQLCISSYLLYIETVEIFRPTNPMRD
ncbi:MAG: hypothetical protein N0E44_19610, partial [Candidatus Thiodiazotropha lotti]|nr:hypothetical protein [Candidatus Thiodiazotropha lotti]MCW4222088.1 hypothetical protein [Candidatus Thiodiazotropha lotti]